MKIHEIKIHQEFNAPVETVWETFSDHTKFGKMLNQDISRIVDSPDPADINGVNSVRRISMPFAAFEETICKSVKYKCIEYQISKGTPLAHHYGTMVFNSLPDGKSSLDYTIEVGSHIPLVGGIIKLALKFAIGSAVKKYANSLKG